jgi:two-component system OmpR family sensor kinase
MNLRTRLTLWYTMLITVTLAVFGGVVWFLLLFSLKNQIDAVLIGTAGQVIKNAAAVMISPGGQLHFFFPLSPFETGDVFLQLYDNNGSFFEASSNLKNVNIPLDVSALHEKSNQTLIQDSAIGQYHLRVLTTPIFSGERVIGYLQVGSRLSQLEAAQAMLLVVLVVGIMAAVILSYLLGLLTVRRALRPLKAVTQTASQITETNDLSRRIPQQFLTQKDEIGEFGRTINATLERLEQLFRSQQQFLSDISHELRTPLTTIRGNVDLMRRMGLGDPESLDAIQSETERLSRLAGDLLTLAQAESGELPLVLQVVELDTILLSVYRDARILAGTKVSVKLGEEDQAIVQGDPDRLKQILLNLITNAIKYTPYGGSITLGLRCIDGWARLTVADTGQGIPSIDLPFIFDRFYRVDKSRTRMPGEAAKVGGTGLGLAIVKWLVEAHHGRIDVVSQLGQGSVFTVWLPLAQRATTV